MKNRFGLWTHPSLALAVAFAASGLMTASHAWAADRHAFAYRLPPAASNSAPVARALSFKRLNLAIGLPLRDEAGLNAFLRELNDRASTNYHHYLTPAQFTERFGPTETDYESVVLFAQTHHLTVTARHPNRLVLDVKGSVLDIEQTFNVKLRVYQHPTESRTFYAPDAQPTIAEAVPVLTVSGLDNYEVPHPMNLKPLAASPAGTGSGPGSTLLGYDFRAAYVPGVALNGTGQTVGLLEFDSGYYQSDITRYENLAGLPNVPVKAVLLDGYNGGAGGGNDEVSLDIEMAISMAPGLSQILVYEGSATDDILSRMATDNQAKQIGASWTYGIDATSETLWKEMIAQGQSFYNASGDSDAYTGPIPSPSDDTNIICVGGTTLTTTGPQGAYVSETVWNWGGGTGSSGGISTVNKIPIWQTGISMTANLGSTTMRNLPDVAMPADNIYVTYGNGQAGSFGGTSCATPLWAAFTALANQLALGNGEPLVGFINPAIYAMGKGSNVLSYTSLFHDITTGNNERPGSGNKFPAVPGYDLCTGWGSPYGSNLLTALALPEPLRITPTPELLVSGPAGGPFTPAPATFSLSDTGPNGLNWSVTSTSVWFTLTPASGTLAKSGTTSVTVSPSATASNLAPGSFVATVGFSNQTDHFAQSRQVTLAIVTPPVITEEPTNQAVPWGASATFSVATAPDALMYYQWQLNGTNLNDGSFNVGTGSGVVYGSSTSTLIVSNAAPGAGFSQSPANLGNFSVIVSNAAGVQISSNALLTIVPSSPIITAQPTNLSVLPGAPASFSVAAVGNHPFSYQWQFNGANIAGATGTSYTLASAFASNAGNFSVIVTNILGSTPSTNAVLAIVPVTVPGLALTPLYSFPTNGLQGDTPYAPLAQGRDGRLYGSTLEGGTNLYGTIFKVTTNGVFNTIYSFNYTLGGFPVAGVIQGSDNNLYGPAYEGGANGDGTVFRLTTLGTGFTTLFTFNGNNGELSQSGLIQGTDGNYYGTTLEGGVYGDGTVFKLTPGGVRTALISFSYSDGAFPSSVLVQGPDGNFYGTTEEGGAYGDGTVFKITPSGVLTTLHAYSYYDGAVPIAGVTLGLDGNYYGTTYEGGTNGFGTVFQITPQGDFTSLYAFDGTNDGANPWAGLLQSSDGNLYGSTVGGGLYNEGTLFRLGLDGEFATIANFDGYEGSTPYGTLAQASDGNLYGTTGAGGAGSYGTVFKLSVSGALQITGQPQDQSVFQGGTARFTVATFGSAPVSYQWQQDGTNLVDGGDISGSTTPVLTITNVGVADAAFYSVVVSNAYGALVSDDAFLEIMVSPPQITGQPTNQNLLVGETAVFSVHAQGDDPLSYQWRENGTNLADGGQITGSSSSTLTIANLTPANAGSYSVVVRNNISQISSAAALLNVLPVSPPGAGLTVSHLFSDGLDGAFPAASLIQGKDGNLYGTASQGGSKFLGEIFRMSLAGGFTSLYSFTGGTDGAEPYAALAQASNGYFYGTAVSGGVNGYGTVFRIPPAGSPFTALYSFTNSNDGGEPEAPLVQATDGNFYGTAFEGGSNSAGTVFKVTTTAGVVTPLYSFTGGNDGAYLYAGLVQGPDGNLHGTAFEGGTNADGTVFTLTTKGALVNAFSFGYTNGANPVGGLVLGPDGNYYGATVYGGDDGLGTIFRLSSNGVLTVLVSFNGTNGSEPAASLIVGTDGNLYGTTFSGGFADSGTVFKLTTNGVLTTLVTFDGLNGANPEAALVQANNGAFYGTTLYGGTGYNGTPSSGQGTVFELVVPAFDVSPFSMPSVTAGLPYAGSIAGKANAVPGDTLTFAKVSGPGWLIVGADGTLSGTPANANIGLNSFVVSLTDTNGISATATMLVNVLAAQAPYFVSNPFTGPAVNEGQAVAGSIAGDAVDPNINDALQFGLVSGPAWLTVQTNGVLAGTPSLSDVGTNTFVVSVTDLLGLSNTATMYIQVDGPPSFVSDPFNAPYAGVGVVYSNSIASSAVDPNAGNTMAYGLVSGPSWLTISNNGALSGTPGSTNAGTNVFIVSATDSGGLSAQATMYLYVYTPPTFMVKPFTGRMAISGVPYSGTIATNAAPDPDVVVGDFLTFGKTTGAAWLNVAPNGQLSGAPSDADVGTELFGVKVTDSVGLATGAHLNITVNTDSPPYFLTNVLAYPDAKSGVAYSGTVATNASDPDLPYGDTLTFVELSGPAWLTLSANGTFAGTPGPGDGGTNTFLISVRDYDGLSNNATMILNVEGPPAFTANPLTVPWANLDQPYAYSLTNQAVEPVAGATMLFGKSSGPSWLNVATNGTISGTPDLSDAGTNTFMVSVTDYRALTNTATLYVYVNSPPVFNPSVFTKSTAVVGVPYTDGIYTNVTDPDLSAGDALTFYKVTGPAWLSVDVDGELSGTPGTSDVGTGTYLVLCVDSGGLAGVGTMNVNVVNGALASPLQIALSPSGAQLNLSWTGGNPPYQVQMCTDLAGGTWSNLGGPMSTNVLSLVPSNAAAWFRVTGQ